MGCARRYTEHVRDLLFLALVVGFFALAAFFARGCERIPGDGGPIDEARER